MQRYNGSEVRAIHVITLPPSITRRTRPEISTFVIQTIEAEGIIVPPSSRLSRMHRLYHSGLATIGPDHPDFEVALESERDMQLLAFSFDQLAGVPKTDAFRALLKKLVQDSVLPQNDPKGSPGRDAGFEIYVGGVCAAHLAPVTWEEPDVACFHEVTKCGLAAKRIKNLKNLYARVRKAVKQIDASSLPGIIVLDLALAFNPENRRLRQMNETIFWAEYEANFKLTWREYQPKVQELMSRGHVLGIVVHDYHVRQQESDWQLTGMTMRVPNETRPAADQRRFDTLSALYTYGLPNQTDSTTRSIILPYE